MIIDDLINKYGEDNKRIKHILGVKKMAVALALKNNVDAKKAEIAALYHDYYRYDSDEKLISLMEKEDYEKYAGKTFMYHGLAAGNDIKRYGINDDDIINSIKYHTSGRKGMSTLEKIIFVSDFGEENRTHEGAKEVREKAYQNLDEAVCLTLNYMYHYLQDDEVKKLWNYYEGEGKMDLLKVVSKTLNDLNAEEINIYDMQNASPFFDYVVIATITSDRQSNAIIRDLRENTNAAGYEIKGIEGGELAWTLIDCKSIVVHIFDVETRAHYGLDKIYSAFKTIDIKEVL